MRHVAKLGNPFSNSVVAVRIHGSIGKNDKSHKHSTTTATLIVRDTEFEGSNLLFVTLYPIAGAYSFRDNGTCSTLGRPFAIRFIGRSSRYIMTSQPKPSEPLAAISK
jgi:hypothetical protein